MSNYDNWLTRDSHTEEIELLDDTFQQTDEFLEAQADYLADFPYSPEYEHAFNEWINNIA